MHLRLAFIVALTSTACGSAEPKNQETMLAGFQPKSACFVGPNSSGAKNQNSLVIEVANYENVNTSSNSVIAPNLVLGFGPIVVDNGNISFGNGAFTCVDFDKPPVYTTGQYYIAQCNLLGVNTEIFTISSGQVVITDYSADTLTVSYDVTVPDNVSLQGTIQATVCDFK